MKYGIIAHIDSDIIALKAVLRAMDSAHVDAVVCAGNIAAQAGHVNECIDIFRERGIQTLLGDFDGVACGRAEPWGFEPIPLAHVMMTRERLSDNNRGWMTGLPMGLLFDDFAVLHGDARTSRISKITWEHLVAQWPFPNHQQGRICFVAHPEKPGVYGPQCERVLDEDGKLGLDKFTNLFISPGRVGRSEDGAPWSSFGLLDTEAGQYQQVHLNLSN